MFAFIVTCKGRLHHLKESLPRLERQASSETILVVSACPDRSGDWARAFCPQVKIVDIEDNGVFNLSRSRNAGFVEVSKPWVVFTDADVILRENFTSFLLDKLDERRFFTFAPSPTLNGLSGTCVVSREAVAKIGGYDDAICCWGGEDKDFYWRLERAGYTRVEFPSDVIERVIQHSDAGRTQFGVANELYSSQTITALYRRLKIYFFDVAPHLLDDVDFRQGLFKQCDEAVHAALSSSDGFFDITIEIPRLENVAFLFAIASESLTVRIDCSNMRQNLLSAARRPQF